MIYQTQSGYNFNLSHSVRFLSILDAGPAEKLILDFDSFSKGIFTSEQLAEVLPLYVIDDVRYYRNDSTIGNAGPGEFVELNDLKVGAAKTLKLKNDKSSSYVSIFIGTRTFEEKFPKETNVTCTLTRTNKTTLLFSFTNASGKKLKSFEVTLPYTVNLYSPIENENLELLRSVLHPLNQLIDYKEDTIYKMKLDLVAGAEAAYNMTENKRLRRLLLTYIDRVRGELLMGTPDADLEMQRKLKYVMDDLSLQLVAIVVQTISVALNK